MTYNFSDLSFLTFLLYVLLFIILFFLLVIYQYCCIIIYLHNKKHEKLQQPQKSMFVSFAVPGKSARNSRRHSYQAGVPGLAKEMDRLKVGSTSGSSPAGSSRGASPRSSTKRRPSVRRSSRSGKYYNFFFHSLF